MANFKGIAFVETTAFTKRVTDHRLEDELLDLQTILRQNPEAGRLDPGTGGLRKVRMSDSGRGKGKRGGARVHYLWLSAVSVIYLIFLYTKDESATLSPVEKKALKRVVDAIKNEWEKD